MDSCGAAPFPPFPFSSPPCSWRADHSSAGPRKSNFSPLGFPFSKRRAWSDSYGWDADTTRSSFHPLTVNFSRFSQPLWHLQPARMADRCPPARLPAASCFVWSLKLRVVFKDELHILLASTRASGGHLFFSSARLCVFVGSLKHFISAPSVTAKSGKWPHMQLLSFP